MFEVGLSQEEIDHKIAKLKLEQDIHAYQSQIADAQRRLLEIDKTKVAIIVRARDLEQKLAEAQQAFVAL